MTRPRFALVALLATGALATGCDDGGKVTPPAGRADSVKLKPGAASAQSEKETKAFCDVSYPAASAPAFALPALSPASGKPDASGAGWRWVNVWATWCKPCLEEMPRLLRWREQLAGAGQPLSLLFVSVDESDAVVDDFRKAHPETPPTVRLASSDALPAWFQALGLDQGAPIPVHVFVDPQGKTRCIRAGGVREQELAIVQQLLAQ
jgi:thiol-disulfide isomerase/thioredoxin